MQVFSKEMNSMKDTIRVVEDSIKRSKGYPTELQLSRSLRGKINRITLKKILAQLERSNKIVYDKDGSIIWISADTARARQSLRDSVLLR
jgi:tRNA A58 N-methylase Trm61